MPEDELPLEDLHDLAEQEISDKRDEVHDEGQARELLDVPSKDTSQVAHAQPEDPSQER